MHNHNDKYPPRTGFESGNSRLQAPVSHRGRPIASHKAPTLNDDDEVLKSIPYINFTNNSDEFKDGRAIIFLICVISGKPCEIARPLL